MYRPDLLPVTQRLAAVASTATMIEQQEVNRFRGGKCQEGLGISGGFSTFRDCGLKGRTHRDVSLYLWEFNKGEKCKPVFYTR